MEKKWYSLHTIFTSLKDELRMYLKKESIKYELSGGIADYHFEIYTDSDGATKINNFIDSISI